LLARSASGFLAESAALRPLRAVIRADSFTQFQCRGEWALEVQSHHSICVWNDLILGFMPKPELFLLVLSGGTSVIFQHLSPELMFRRLSQTRRTVSMIAPILAIAIRRPSYFFCILIRARSTTISPRKLARKRASPFQVSALHLPIHTHGLPGRARLFTSIEK
jgi:hypothetical protein